MITTQQERLWYGQALTQMRTSHEHLQAANRLQESASGNTSVLGDWPDLASAIGQTIDLINAIESAIADYDHSTPDERQRAARRGRDALAAE